MPREYNFGNKTVIEEDDSGNVSVKNVDSLSTDSIQNNGNPISVGDDLSLDRGQVISGPVDQSFISIDEYDVSDGSKTPLSSRVDRFAGLAVLHDDSNTQTALLFANLFEVQLISQTASHFSPTSGNSGTVNIYHDGNDQVIYVENQTGGNSNFELTILSGGF